MASQTEKQTAVTAIIETGGKQFRVTPGQTISVEKLEGEVGSKITFDRVILISDQGNVQLGSELDGKQVVGEITQQAKGQKIRVFTYKSKKRQRRTLGHRQLLTEVKILEVGGSKAAKAEKAQKTEKASAKSESKAPTKRTANKKA